MQHNVVHVWSASLDEPPLSQAELLSVLTDDERQRAIRFRQDCDRRRSIASRGLLRWLLGRYLGREPSSLEFCVGPNGKPALAGEADLGFSVSHSAGFVLYALARHSDLGVDVEHVRDIADVAVIAQSYFAPGERAALGLVTASERSRMFLVGWTRKEAYLKAIGIGLSAHLDTFEVSLTEARCCVDDPSSGIVWHIYHLEPWAGFVGAVAVPGSQFRIACWHWGSVIRPNGC